MNEDFAELLRSLGFVTLPANYRKMVFPPANITGAHCRWCLTVKYLRVTDDKQQLLLCPHCDDPHDSQVCEDCNLILGSFA